MSGTEAQVISDLPNNKMTQARSQNKMRFSNGEEIGSDILSSISWVQDIFSHPHTELLASCGAMSSPTEFACVDPDHLFLSMLRQRLVSDICFMYNSEEKIFYTVVALGPDVAGHPRIVRKLKQRHFYIVYIHLDKIIYKNTRLSKSTSSNT